MDRLVADFAEDVPEGDVDGGGGAVFGTGAGLRHGQVEHLSVVSFDVEGIAAEQAAGEGVVDVGFDGAGTVEGFA